MTIARRSKLPARILRRRTALRTDAGVRPTVAIVTVKRKEIPLIKKRRLVRRFSVFSAKRKNTAHTVFNGKIAQSMPLR